MSLEKRLWLKHEFVNSGRSPFHEVLLKKYKAGIFEFNEFLTTKALFHDEKRWWKNTLTAAG